MRLLLISLLVLAGCSRPLTSRGPLPHEVYIWQRHWTPAVREGLERATPFVASFDALIGEIEIKGGATRTVVAETDYATLASSRRPVALGLRIATYSGPFSPQAKPFVAAVQILRTALAQAAKAGVQVTELQIDFDCPSARLAGYAEWVREFHSAFPHTPITITALPDWLKQRDFALLARNAGRFVLQVHSVPNTHGIAPVLCDTTAARKSIILAGRLGVPFRVALPTYSCELLTDAKGRIAGVHAEDSPFAPASGHILLRANAAELAALVHDWEFSRPAALKGVIWYRLPIDTDQLNWRWTTLAAIISGKTPQPQGKLLFRPSGPGVEDAVLENTGDADWAVPTELFLPHETVAADGVNGFHLENADGGAPKLHGAAGRILAPGAHLVCGWIRRDASHRTATSAPNFP